MPAYLREQQCVISHTDFICAGPHPQHKIKMALTTKQKQFLRAQAHHLSPVVLLGQHGLTEAVMAEIELALGIHELIKVRIPGQDREDKKAMMHQIATTTAAELVQTVGHMAVFYRPDPDGARLILPKPERAGGRKPL